MAVHGDVWWTELTTHHPEAARKFYAKVMGWQPFVAAMADMQREAKPGEPAYTTFMHNGKPLCGCFHLEGEMFKNVPDHWFTYFQVTDVDTAAKAIVAAGGKTIRPAWDIPGVGRIGIMQDSSGAMFGIGKPAAMMPAAPHPAEAKAEAKPAAKAKKTKK